MTVKLVKFGLNTSSETGEHTIAYQIDHYDKLLYFTIMRKTTSEVIHWDICNDFMVDYSLRNCGRSETIRLVVWLLAVWSVLS